MRISMTAVGSVLALAAFLVPAPALSAVDGTALLKQIDRNLNPESYEAYRKIINVEPSGKKKEFTLFTVKKGKDKVAGLFLATPFTSLGDVAKHHHPFMPVRLFLVEAIFVGLLGSLIGGALGCGLGILQAGAVLEFSILSLGGCLKAGGLGLVLAVPGLDQGDENILQRRLNDVPASYAYSGPGKIFLEGQLRTRILQRKMHQCPVN